MSKLYHCIILSTKSAGSSALQNLLVQNYGFNKTQKTLHHENETLFWTKAASILELAQLKMHRSKVPYSKAEALVSLNQFCKDNFIGTTQNDNASREELFNLYYNLISRNKPYFVEKSPHHLHSQSNLELINEFIYRHQNEIKFKVLGLVRHPLSVIYSGWKRWRFDCSQFEKEWYVSNSNLLKYKSKLNIITVRYEDLVAENGAVLQEKLNLEPVAEKFCFKSSSLYKWKHDVSFGHKLSDETIQLAKELGYDDFETPGDKLSWKIRDLTTYAGVEMKRLLR